MQKSKHSESEGKKSAAEDYTLYDSIHMNIQARQIHRERRSGLPTCGDGEEDVGNVTARFPLGVRE